MGMALEKEEVRVLVEEILRVGFALGDLLATLVEQLPEDAYPGENPAEVVIEMTTGSLMPVAESAGEAVVREATALVGAVFDRIIGDLRHGVEIARERQ
jgi:hypothetical protein